MKMYFCIHIALNDHEPKPFKHFTSKGLLKHF